MIVTSDLHTHTMHSHGSGSVEENVLAAIKKGLKTVAVSDHGPGHNAYGIKDIEKYLEDILRCKNKYKGIIDVLSGIELNLVSLDGELDLPKGYEDSFDILLFGYHKFVSVADPKTFFMFYLPKSGSDKAVEKATNAYINAVSQYNIDIITHPGYGLPLDKAALAKAAAKKGTALEINAKHPEFTESELKSCISSGVMFSLNSDAHSPERIGDISPAISKAIAANIPVSQIINAKE